MEHNPKPPASPPEPDMTEEQRLTVKIRERADNVQACRVCWDEYHGARNPARLLSCGHSFCTRCVVSCSNPEMQVNDDNDEIRCPECRRVSKQPPATFPVNFQLMQILTTLSLLRTPRSEEEEEKELPSANFDTLGTILPVNKMKELSMTDLMHHGQVYFDALRHRANEDKPKSGVLLEIANTVMNRINELQRIMEDFVKSWDKIKKGQQPRQCWHLRSGMTVRRPHIQTMQEILDTSPIAARRILDPDFMRDMVVYRPPPNVADYTNPPVDELQAVIEQEQIAQAEADPARQIDTIREAHMRRERENARNQELMRLLADGNTEVARFRLPSNVESRLQEINQQVELCYAADTIQYQELCERDHNDEEQLLSDLDEEEQDPDNMSNADSNDSSYVEREIRPAQARLMTHGEAVTLLRMIDTISPNCSRSPLPPSSRTFPYGKDSIEEVINHVFPRYTDPGKMMTPELIKEIRRYYLVNGLNMEEMLKSIRRHSVRFASTVVESPRIIRRIRRQRPVPLNDYQALMTIIRRRAKDALRGNRPDQPIDEEEENLTMRLIVNVATSLGVRDKLEGFLCPHPNGHCDEQQNSRQSSSQNSSQSPIHRHLETQRFLTPSPEEIIVPFVTSSRQRTLYCKVCNCKVPEVAKQGHENGRRHVANLTRLQQQQQINE